VQAETDRELVLLMQRGDLDALGALYDRHHQRVYRTALGITNDRDAASDLLQDVFLRVYRFAKRIDPDRPLEPWLYRVTANLAYTHIKRRNRWYRYLFEIGDWFNRELSPGPQRQLEMDEEAARVRKAVASLPISQRMVVVLYYCPSTRSPRFWISPRGRSSPGCSMPGIHCVSGLPCSKIGCHR
jgi:RNA polymerase sigma factor (sigma-70 family)